MPLYEIQHTTPLTPTQRTSLADRITTLHSTKFTTPRMFVNVRFTDSSSTPTYIGGKLRPGNHIIGNVRIGPSRTQKDFDDLCVDIVKAWDEVLGGEKGEGDRDLRSCIMLGGMIGGYEAGFLLPPAGGDVAWLKENLGEFERKAKEGDEDFVDLVREVKERKLV